ncbi:remodeling and spacing factor 1 isoform X2 [Falco biarmicus]|uniref:remodeling and spacing factor 1 isoform X1 n=1 Tax=Falco rusticolus TaxID=120794 RepID=UPI001886987B|nr:remodeling and spacing factor 1 isoform X1 [Falco rusticolus]XP_055559290.1 remodeling and spacing factor 1 isoform X2 [Falco cherrug]XP_055659183.1 remodeling and spacing factor 1 isoform X2 [Falco peregrinus]XP_056182974.1 remodeling and spacing factor 1 isoform X2 [Falco biarmicus]
MAAAAAPPAPSPPPPPPAGPCCPGSWPNFAVVCSFLERYGALLDLPELPFPELERVLQPPQEPGDQVPKELVELHLKLMRKIGKSVTADRWEKYLIKICQEFNSTWAWEMEKKGYLEMSVECKLGILKYLCECQFDDNLKFKNIINEEDADAMRLQPIGRDKDGLMYWYQLDQEHNVRMYIEEQDDQDGSTWKCIVRNRNELAETLELLKAQIDPALLKNNNSQPENSSRESPSIEDEDTKKGEEGSTQENQLKIKEEQEEVEEQQPLELESLPVPVVKEDENMPKAEKVEEKEIIKLPVIVKLEKPSEYSEEKQTVKEESDSFKENVKPVKVEVKENKTEPKDLKEVKSATDKIAVHEPERLEFCVNVKTPQEIVEKSVEESEKLKNDQQAKIPLKKREIKLTDDYDSPIKGPLCKCVTPTKDVLKEEGKPEEEAFKRVPTITALCPDGKVLVNGEVSCEKITPSVIQNNKSEHSASTKEDSSSLKEKNGKSGEKVSDSLNSVSKTIKTCEVEKNTVTVLKETGAVDSEVSNQKVPLKEESSPVEKEPLDSTTPETVVEEESSNSEDCAKTTEEKLATKIKKDRIPPPKECLEKLEKSTNASAPAELPKLALADEETLKSKGESEEKPVSPKVSEIPPAATSITAEKPVLEKEDSDGKTALLEESKAEEKSSPEKQEEEPEAAKTEPERLDDAQASNLEDSSESKKESPVPKSKFKYKLVSEEESCATDNKEITSERQKEGIKLTIRISSRKRKAETPPEEVSIGRTLRRSPRISKPTPKVVETRDQKPDKKRPEEEEEKPAAAQKPERKEDAKKQEKEPNSKVNKRSKVRWTGTRTRGRWKYSSNEESEDSESEKNSNGEEEEEEEEEEEAAPADDDEPCKKCGLPNHPELILLCDSCDSGYHTACLRPPLMIIPDGEWFCPPCQHKLLCEKLEEQLQDLDVVLKKKERAERRKERLVYVGISIENIIPPQEPEIPEGQEEKKKDSKKPKSKLLERRSTRTRKCISYRFDEFDEAIDEAIEDDIKEADGGGIGRGKDMSNITGHRGKDISTILEEERKENKRPQRAAAARRKKRRRLNDLDSDSNLDEEESEDEFKISDGSQDEFVISEENLDESEDDPPSNEDSDSEFCARISRRHLSRPMRQSRRLRRKTVKKKYSEDDEDEDSEDNSSRESESGDYTDYSDDDYLETRRRRSRRNQKRQVNYKEDSESDGSQKSVRYGKELRRVHKRRLSTSDSEESYTSKNSEDDESTKESKRLIQKRRRSTDDYSEEGEDEEDEGRPVRKRLNRIETDDEDNCENANDDAENPAPANKLPAPQAPQDNTKKHCYRIESDDEDDFDNVGKVESPLDYSLVDLPSTNGQSPGKTIENLIGKPSEKTQAPKDSTASASLAPNGTGSGQEAVGPEEDEDELLRVTDLVDYVCNSEQL